MTYLLTDFWVSHAYNLIYDTYGDVVRVKPKNLLKFGRNENVTTGECTIMELAGSETAETYVSTNAITHVISDDANTGDLYIEGHTISGSDLTFATQTVTLTGTTAKALTTPLARATRA